MRGKESIEENAVLLYYEGIIDSDDYKLIEQHYAKKEKTTMKKEIKKHNKAIEILKEIKGIDNILESFKNLEGLHLSYKSTKDKYYLSLNNIFKEEEIVNLISNEVVIGLVNKRRKYENEYFRLFPDGII